jgi:hypothetical protein
MDDCASAGFPDGPAKTRNHHETDEGHEYRADEACWPTLLGGKENRAHDRSRSDDHHDGGGKDPMRIAR